MPSLQVIWTQCHRCSRVILSIDDIISKVSIMCEGRCSRGKSRLAMGLDNASYAKR